MRQSFTWWSFSNRGVEPLALLKAAADIGYDGVEMLPPDWWTAARDIGLSLATLIGHGPIHEGLNQRQHHARIAAAVNESLDRAVAQRVPTIILFAGNRQPGVSDDEAAEITADGLRQLAPRAESAGVDLVLELLNSKVNHKGYQADRTEWGVKVCKLVGSPRVKLLYDIYHMQIMEGDLIQTIADDHGYFGHYHTAGCPGRGDLDDEQEIYYPAILRAIARTGYAGYVGHEFLPKSDPVAGLKHAFELTRTALAAG